MVRVTRGEKFPPELRLRQGAEFKNVLRGRHRQRGSGFIVISVPNQYGFARLGIVVGRKALRRAVDRNRFKRLAREQFRRVAARLRAVDVIVQAQGKLDRGQLTQMQSELSQMLRAAGE